MKLRSALCTVAALFLLPLALSAQVAPAPGSAAATPAKKPVLSSADRQLLKGAAEPQLLLIHLSEIYNSQWLFPQTGRGLPPPGSPAVQKFAESAKKPLHDAWGEMGTIAVAKRAPMPAIAQSAAEERDLAELRKQNGDKFDKAFLKAFQKEAKRTNTAFTAGANSAQDPELKALFTKYQPIIAKLEADAIALPTEGKK